MRTAARIRQAALVYARRYGAFCSNSRCPPVHASFWRPCRDSPRLRLVSTIALAGVRTTLVVSPAIPSRESLSRPLFPFHTLLFHRILTAPYPWLVRSLLTSPRPYLWLVRSLHSSPSLFLRPVLCAPEYILRCAPCRLHDLNVLPAVDRELQRRQRRVLRPRHTVAASWQQRCRRRVVPAVAGIPRGDRPQAVEPEPTPPPPPPCRRCSFGRVLDGFRLHASVPAWVGEQVLPSWRRERLRVRPSAPALPG